MNRKTFALATLVSPILLGTALAGPASATLPNTGAGDYWAIAGAGLLLFVVGTYLTYRMRK